MWDLKACRSCLSTTAKLERAAETTRRIYASVTGLEFNTGDGYPTYFCIECHSQLKKCLSFRRKSRRAYYALNRFMTSKKQITLNDIVTVNRRRNNLTSSLGNCKRANVACYRFSDGATVTDVTDDNETKVNNDETKVDVKDTKTLTAQEFYHDFLSGNQLKTETTDQTDANIQQEEPKGNLLEKYDPINFGSVFQTVLIKSVEQLEEEKAELLKVLEERPDDNCNDNDFENEEETKLDIDFNDIFKDLVEEEKNSESEPEPEPEPVKKTRKQLKADREEKKKQQLLEKEKEKIVKRMSRSLSYCEVKLQSPEEQLENWQKKMQLEPYKSARVKCLVCVKPFDKIDLLMEHVKYHNNINTSGNVVQCPICKGNFSSAEELEQHNYEMHLYLFECKHCPLVLNTLKDFSFHFHAKHYVPKATKSTPLGDLAVLYDLVLLSTEEMKSTVSKVVLVTEYQCDRCSLYFRNANSLSLHSKKHDLSTIPPTAVICEYCNVWFATKAALNAHMERWHLYSYKCKKCHMVLYCKEDALKHRDKHMVKGQLDEQCNCPYCGASTNTRSLNFHIFKMHFTDKYCHHCIVCGRSSSKAGTLYKHQLEEHDRIYVPTLKIGDPQFTCTHCDVQFLNQDAYFTHLLKHKHPEASEIPFACILCRVRYDNEEEHNLHLRRCKNKKYPRNCIYCNIVLTCTADSVKHYMTVHKELSYHRLGPAAKCRRYVLCEICGASVKNNKIAAHRRVHEEGLLRCLLCTSQQFTTARQVVLHVLKCHCDKPFICMICQYKFKQRGQCRDHILKTHAPVRPYSCLSCPLKFSHVDYLNEHAFKIHGVPLPGRGPKKKLRGVCTTYPHMQVDVSLVPENVLKDVQFRICDYHDKNLTPLRDISRFFIVNRTTPLQAPGLAEIEVQINTLKRSYEEYENTPPFVKVKKVKVEPENVESFITIKSQEDTDDVKVESVPDYQDFETEVLQEEILLEDEVNEDAYEVMEGEDGDQYVYIDGVVYKIEQQVE